MNDQRPPSADSSILEFNLEDDELERQIAGTLASEKGSENETHHSSESDVNSNTQIRTTKRKRRRAQLSKRPADFNDYSINLKRQGSGEALDQNKITDFSPLASL